MINFFMQTLRQTMAMFFVFIINQSLFANDFEVKGIMYDSCILSPFYEGKRMEAIGDPVRVVQLTQSGTLLEQIGIENIESIESLKIVGEVNGTDILTIRKMNNLRYLDMSEANIVNGGISYYQNYTTSKDKIGDYFFMDRNNLETIILPNTVTSIGIHAFHNCSGLKSMTIPNSVTSIGTWAFNDCSSLTSVTIPNSITSIDAYAFWGCSGLTSVTIPNSVTSIGSGAFEDCSSLKSVTIPNSVTSIGEGAFGGCSGLKSMTIPNSVTSIGRHAFRNCSGLKSMTIPNSVTYIGEHAFRDCSNLTSVTIPNSVMSIDKSVFDGCSGLTSVTIPNSVTSIGTWAFNGCSSLTSVTIPNSVTYIDRGAFEGSGLTSVTIPNSVTSIGSDAFLSCDSLKSVTIEDGTETLYFLRDTWTWRTFTGDLETLYLGRHIRQSLERSDLEGSHPSPFRGKKTITSLTIGNSVTYIDDDAFENCSGLTSVTIGNNVTSIRDKAFKGCSSLAYVISLNTTPPVIRESTFDEETEKNAILYVPIGSKNTYWLHPYWENFSNIIEDGVNIFTLTYIVDGQIYKTYSLLEGQTVSPESDPFKEGYTFSGWDEVPAKMPAHNVTVNGSFLTTITPEGGEWTMITDDFDKSTPITKIRVLNKSTSSGVYCCAFFSTQPNDDTTEDTKYNINFNRLTIGDGVVQDDYNGIIYINTCKSVGDDWYEYEFKQPVYFSHYQKNAAKNGLKSFVSNETDLSGIDDVFDIHKSYQIFRIDGRPVSTLQKGVNIIRYLDGQTKKVYIPF